MSSLALYRTYRPGRFADVVGQDHVTGPLTRALANDRVHHAYLFSGPRGCGKTSSARILARSLNCEKGPTADPCGECRSCTALAPNGPGSIDVIELDAATHGLVDDARELREKAHFAPVASRFKIYIIDEAHQLGPGAANALLKLIEEPPEHLKFIFATTAPDKIIGTIRSRTHHYPFRLIPARTLQENLRWIGEQEGIAIEPAALGLVARAAGGSARDAQSILGQLIAGAGDEGVTYDLAVALLGFTDAALLDQVVDAIAGGDGSAVFNAVDQVVDSGHDPRRFLTDLLERFRDLIVVQAAPDAATSGLIDAPPEEMEQIVRQAQQFGRSDLVRLADVVDEGITAMKGATPTRLALELVCARLLLPGAGDQLEDVLARLDRLERRPVPTGSPSAPAQAPPPASSGRDAPRATTRHAEQPQAGSVAPAGAPSGQGSTGPPESPGPSTRSSADATAPSGGTAAQPASEASSGRTGGSPASGKAGSDVQASPEGPDTAGGQVSDSSAGHYSVADMRRSWPQILDRLREIKRTPWSLISQECSVQDMSEGVLTLGFQKPNLRDTFARREDFQDNLRLAIRDVLAIEVRFEAIVAPSTEQSGGRGAPGAANSASGAPDSSRQPSGRGKGGDGAPVSPAPEQQAATSARQEAASRAAESSAQPASASEDPDAHVDPDDRDHDDSGLSEQELLQRTLGATVIEEIHHT